jgi:type II secretory pathway pseudopilin PulG
MNGRLKQNGFALLETVVSVAIFATVSMGIFLSYKQVMSVLYRAQARSGMAALAGEQFEIIRNLPFAQIGTQGGIPAGVIPPVQTFEKAGVRYVATTTIRNIDLPFDGVAPSDTSPEDNRQVHIDISCLSCRDPITTSFTAQYGPRDLESSSSNGSLFVRTIDATGQPVEGATVVVKVDPPDTVVNLTDTTGASGMLQLVGAPPAKNAYQVWVSKPGYSSDQTHGTYGPTTTKPLIPHATVDAGEVTQLTFAIDRLSVLNISSISPLCAPIPNIPFSLRGTKLIGSEPIYKYDKTHTTGGDASVTLSSIEWDTYGVTANKEGYDLVGVIPSPEFTVAPGVTQDAQLVLLPHNGPGGENENTVVAYVKDSVTGLPISGADVLFEGSSDDASGSTGRGQLRQTDWSLGGGQELFEDLSRYAGDDGNINATSPAGALRLKQVAGSYVSEGTLTSSIIDTGAVSNYFEFRFLPTVQPPQTEVRFQIATANATSGPWIFRGPDYATSTYFTATTTMIHEAHDGDRYVRYKTFLSTANPSVTPSVEEVAFTFTSSCVAPGQTYAQMLHNGTWTLTASKTGYITGSETVTMGTLKPWATVTILLDPE